MSIQYQLPIQNTIATAWKKTYGVKGIIWVALGVLFLIGVGIQILQMLLFAFPPIVAICIAAIAQFIFLLIQTGLFYFGIYRAYDLPFRYNLMFKTLNPELAWKIIVLYILQVIIVFMPLFAEWLVYYLMMGKSTTASTAAAVTTSTDTLTLHAQSITSSVNSITFFTVLILSKIIMVYLFIKMMLSLFYVLDKKMNPWSAIKLSFIATKHNVLRLLALIIIQIVLVVISMIPFGLGLIWTAPFSIVFYGVIYKRLVTKAD